MSSANSTIPWPITSPELARIGRDNYILRKVCSSLVGRPECPHVQLPPLRDLCRRAIPQFAEALVAPLVLFYVGLSLLGPKGAICTALAWNIVVLLRRLLRRERPSGLLPIGTIGLTARSLFAVLSQNSLFVYFLQPSLAAAVMGGVFLLSVPLGCPLAEESRSHVPWAAPGGGAPCGQPLAPPITQIGGGAHAPIVRT
jgi:hypothetical protein